MAEQTLNEDDFLSLRYLNDLLFCERRVALHLLEQIWTGNQFTAEGEYAHRKVDRNCNVQCGDKRGLPSLQHTFEISATLCGFSRRQSVTFAAGSMCVDAGNRSGNHDHHAGRAGARQRGIPV